jgi:hypothetical protein
MAPAAETAPVEDTVAKVGNELAVGEDLEFQRKWWKFEKIAWGFFVLLVLLDVAGVFGRGPAAKAHTVSTNRLMNVNYERIERFSTPSILTVHFSPDAVQDGKIYLWVSDSVVTKLGNQRVIPQPSASVTGNGGIFYTFLAAPLPNSVEFALEPAGPGVSQIQMRVLRAASNNDPASQEPLDSWSAKIFTMP